MSIIKDKKKVGRPSTGRQRDKVIYVRCTEEEKKTVDNLVKKIGEEKTAKIDLLIDLLEARKNNK